MAIQLPAFLRPRRAYKTTRRPRKTSNSAQEASPRGPRWTTKSPSYYKKATIAHNNSHGLPSINSLSAGQRNKLSAIAALLASNKKLAKQFMSATTTNIAGNSMAGHAKRRAQPLPGRRRSPSPKRRAVSPKRTVTMNNLW